MNILVPMGAPSEIVKLGPVVHTLATRGFDVRVVVTGECEDAAFCRILLERFGVQPEDIWQPPSDEAERIGRILELALAEVRGTRPDCVLLVGGGYTVSLFTLAARRFSVPVVQLEAGLRSFDERGLEEVNRRVGTHAASIHLAPTEMAARFLEKEGIQRSRIKVVGDPTIDALRLIGVRRRPPSSRIGVVVRMSDDGVDAISRLDAVVELILKLGDEYGPVTMPVSSATRSRLVDSGYWAQLRSSPVRMLPHLPFDGIAELVATARVVITDSHELNEEAAWLGVPIVVLRSSTTRWEGVAAGIAALAGSNVDRAAEAVRRFCRDDEQRRVAAVECPYGDGLTSDRVVEVLMQRATRDLLGLEEPDFVDKQLGVSEAGELLVG